MTLETMVETVVAAVSALPQPADRRLLVAVAGAPASGKSTLAEAVAARLCAAGTSAHLVSMDGFHLDNSILEERGLLARKGAPETFDAAGFARLVGALRTNAEVVIPSFDRARDMSINCARVLPATCDIAVVEGNYLLLDVPAWRDLASMWDFTVWLDVPREVLQARLIGRWLDHGLDDAAARARALGNDIPNADLIMSRSRAADLTLTGG